MTDPMAAVERAAQPSSRESATQPEYTGPRDDVDRSFEVPKEVGWVVSEEPLILEEIYISQRDGGRMRRRGKREGARYLYPATF